VSGAEEEKPEISGSKKEQQTRQWGVPTAGHQGDTSIHSGSSLWILFSAGRRIEEALWLIKLHKLSNTVLISA